MAKIVLNVCYGGYGGCSKEAAELYLKLSGKILKYVPERDDLFWVKTVERLGSAANTFGTQYKVVEYDENRFALIGIDEYDGKEVPRFAPIINIQAIAKKSEEEIAEYLRQFAGLIYLRR